MMHAQVWNAEFLKWPPLPQDSLTSFSKLVNMMIYHACDFVLCCMVQLPLKQEGDSRGLDVFT